MSVHDHIPSMSPKIALQALMRAFKSDAAMRGDRQGPPPPPKLPKSDPPNAGGVPANPTRPRIDSPQLTGSAAAEPPRPQQRTDARSKLATLTE